MEEYRGIVSENGKVLELDFYYPELKLALEYQVTWVLLFIKSKGEQHYKYTPIFHGNHDNFEAGKIRDQNKREICKNKGTQIITKIN